MYRIKAKIDYQLLAILSVAAFLYLINLNQIGNANPFYTAAVGSMGDSWKAFFFSSFDPTSFISVDKPPIALWIMVLSSKIFGLSGWSTTLPSVLGSLGSIYLLYQLVKTHFGQKAGRIAALFMTLTPIVVADARSNNMDAIMLFFLLLAARFLQKAVDKQHFLHLLAAFAVIGIAFNVKMLEAFMILPSMLLYYCLASGHMPLKKKLCQLTAALLVLGCFSFAYPEIVDHIPENQRPYVGSSQNDSLTNLAFGYNGSQRLLGQSSGISSTHQGMKNSLFMQGQFPAAKQETQRQVLQKLGQPGNIGTPGPWRLFGLSLGTQISWYLPLALFCLIFLFLTLVHHEKHFFRLNQKDCQIVFWGSWLLLIGAFFSIAGFFHPYYTNILAPAIAALAAIFLIQMQHLEFLVNPKMQRFAKKLAILLPVAATLLLQNYFSYYYIAILAASLLTGFIVYTLWYLLKKQYSRHLLAVLLAFVCLLPALWSTMPVFGQSASFPAASPRLLLGNSLPKLIHRYANIGNTFSKNRLSVQARRKKDFSDDLLAFLSSRASQNNHSQYMFATTDASTAAPFMIQSHKSVMAIGGYNGTDPAISLNRFKQLVWKNKIRYFYFGNRGLRLLDPHSQNAQIADWIIDNGKIIRSLSNHSDDPQHKDQLYQITLRYRHEQDM